MSERDKRVKAFEKLMRGGLSSTDVFCMKTQLMTMGFFTAPASTKYHGNYEGGLFDHNYAVLKNMYHSRQNHKLDEWREFCKWVETLPYSQLITG